MPLHTRRLCVAQLRRVLAARVPAVSSTRSLATSDVRKGEALGMEFRALLRNLVPTPVLVLTALETDGAVRGVTIGSFSSVSAAPPSISFSLKRESRMCRLLENGQSLRFCVNVLGEKQRDVAVVLAQPFLTATEQAAAMQRAGSDFALLDGKVPCVPDALGILVCSDAGSLVAGDHRLFLAQVEQVVRTGSPAGSPLVYLSQEYGSFIPCRDDA